MTLMQSPTEYDLAFYVDKNTLQKAKKWLKTHSCIHKENNTISWRFTLCGIGMSTVVQCSCGKEKDLTDYDSW